MKHDFGWLPCTAGNLSGHLSVLPIKDIACHACVGSQITEGMQSFPEFLELALHLVNGVFRIAWVVWFPLGVVSHNQIFRLPQHAHV